MNTTTNLADYGHRERLLLINILQAWCDKGLPRDFSDDGVVPVFNSSSGSVFLSNDDGQVAMMNGDTLESFYTTPHAGWEGFFSELAADYADMDEADKVYMRELAESLGRSSELGDEQEPESDDEQDTDE